MELNRLHAKARLQNAISANGTDGMGVDTQRSKRMRLDERGWIEVAPISGSSTLSRNCLITQSTSDLANPSISTDRTGTGTGRTKGGDLVPGLPGLPGLPSQSGQGPKKRGGIPSIVQSSYIEYDFSKIRDTKAGFLTDDTHPISGSGIDPQLQLRLQQRYNPPLHLDASLNLKCATCPSPELDFQFLEIFRVRVCTACKANDPDKFSLLTKTECRQDYLLTDPELKDVEILPHLLKPNPHSATYSSMMLYLRGQVEAFAFKKWGSPEALDAEFERREVGAKVKKERKFEEKLRDLRKRTRVAKWSKKAAKRMEGRHEHQFSREAVDPSTGMAVRSCAECGMESEEILM